jgi:hypothetical protein
MPTPGGVIDQFLHPPLGLLNPVLDENGPYGPGTSTRSNFTTSGAFLLPAGTYAISGTYGVIAVVNGAIPPTAGFANGWDDVGYPLLTGIRWDDRFAQVNVIHTLLSGIAVITQQFDLHTLVNLATWDVALPAVIGIWVNPYMAIDLYYLCVL